MRNAIFVVIAGIMAVLESPDRAPAASADNIAQDGVQSAGLSLGAKELAQTVRGKICTTRQGAKLTFTQDGHYTYDGLWKSSGHYSISNDAIHVLLDSGLERSFVTSRRRDTLYLEGTAISCN